MRLTGMKALIDRWQKKFIKKIFLRNGRTDTQPNDLFDSFNQHYPHKFDDIAQLTRLACLVVREEAEACGLKTASLLRFFSFF
ncbi:MAG: hypothetical protein H6R25_1004 [Proteobacteria bacterium]|nr:hypothetical protein [Pseudomonadota bacterium]